MMTQWQNMGSIFQNWEEFVWNSNKYLVDLILNEKSLEEISEFRKYIRTGSGSVFPGCEDTQYGKE